ncbi:MAG: autotransporter domain-containing protein [Pseudoxanthomonas sp.]|nr:autotransporter domain-containing protein [Pseudoxanthomonas sp.]
MFPNRTTLALCVAALLVSGCSSGGGAKPTAAAAAPPPPTTTPPPGAFNPCPAPVASDCTVALGKDQWVKLPETASSHALVVSGTGRLGMVGEYRFDGGTRIEGGGLLVGSAPSEGSSLTRLQSDVTVEAAGELMVVGTVQGDVTNRGMVILFEKIQGDVENAGTLRVAAAAYGNQVRIGGNFSQGATGVLAFALSPAGWDSPVPLTVDGRADLAGTLQLETTNDAWGPYPLPAARAHRIIHATGGVSGQFDRWTSPGLFIEGSLRYGSNDVWFDLLRVELAATMQASQASGLSVASAGNIDSALTRADGYAGIPPPSLDLAQRQFLASASSLLWMQDRAQAERALGSLAGHAHAAMGGVLHGQVAAAAARDDARLSTLAYSPQPSAWSEPTLYTANGQSFAGASSGFALWLSPRLLVGGSIGDSRGSLHFDRLGGEGQAESPAAGLHAHYRGEGWHLTGAVGAQHPTLRLQRPIELGAAGTHLALSQRGFEQAFVHGEVGGDRALAGGRLSPFAAVDYTRLRSDGFAEWGTTGFELVGAAGTRARLSGSVGARYARDWAVRGSTIRLDLDARYHRLLAEDSDAPIAAFRGVPDVRFELPSEQQDGFAEVRLGLGGILGRHWNWSMDYSRGFGAGYDDELLLALQGNF